VLSILSEVEKDVIEAGIRVELVDVEDMVCATTGSELELRPVMLVSDENVDVGERSLDYRKSFILVFKSFFFF
jgi:hypothetical protein